MSRAHPRHTVLYDGDCPFCRRCVAWVRKRDHLGRLHLLPYQDAPSPPLTPALRAACGRSVHVLTAGGQTLNAGPACLFILATLGQRRTARILARRPLLDVVERGYRFAARNRGLLGRWWRA